MDALRELLIPLLWLVFLTAWLAMSRRIPARPRREPRGTRRVALAVLAGAVLLLVLPSSLLPVLDARFAPRADWLGWGGVGLTAVGLLLAGKARVHLIAGISRARARGQDAALVTSGPYALVRHPLYAGLLLAFAGTVLTRGEVRGLLALALAGLFLGSRMRVEERRMEQDFGDAYRAYAKRVAALIPFVW